VAAFALVGAACGQAPPPSDSAAPAPRVRPEWVGPYMEGMIGIWIADNAKYRSDAEPFEAYGIEWKWGAGRQSLAGRLYAIVDGRDAGTSWDFREFWHPGEGRLLASQFGTDGTFGIGPHERLADGTLEMVQTFYDPSGKMTRVGHRSRIQGDEMITQSFDVSPNGAWTDRRTYTWRRQPVGS
jgi:hypothetical protein